MLKRRLGYLFVACMCLLPVGGAAVYSYCFLINGTSEESKRDIIQCDLGDVPPGSKVDKTIAIPNETKNVLTVKSVRKDCACIVQGLAHASILPGEHADLRLQYETPTIQGPIERLLEVSFRETAKPTVIYITGTVRSWATVDPPAVVFSEVCVGRRIEKEVVVLAAEAWPESKRALELQLEYGEIVRDKSLQDDRQQRFRLAFTPPKTAACKRYEGELVIRWVGREERVLRVPCIATAVSQWSVDPSQAFFGIVPKGASKEINLEIRDRGGSANVNLANFEVIHNLGSSFRVRSAMMPINTLMVFVMLNTSKEMPGGFLKGRIDVLRPPTRDIMVSIPVMALVR